MITTDLKTAFQKTRYLTPVDQVLSMKVLIIPAEPYPINESFLESVYSRPNGNYEVVFLTTSESVKHFTVRKWNRVKIYVFPTRGSNFLTEVFRKYFFEYRFFFTMSRVIDHERPDIIQARDITSPLLFALFFKSIGRIKAVIYQKTHPHECRKVKTAWNYKFGLLAYLAALIDNTLLHQILLHFCDVIFPISGPMAVQLATKYGIPDSKLYPMRMGINRDELPFHVTPKSISKEIKLIYAGTLSVYRKLERMIEGVLQLQDKYPHQNITITLLGGTMEEFKTLIETFSKKDLTGTVKYAGFLPRKEVFSLINHSHIGVSYIPDDRMFIDASPTKLYEYLACGLPVIGTSCVLEQKDLINHTGAGVLCDDSADGVTNALIELIERYAFYADKALLSREMILKENSYTTYQKTIRSIYSRLLKEKSH